MGRKTDQFWGYVEKLNNRRFKCMFCDSEFCGGASRIKAHLAGLQGQGIAVCKRVSEAVKAEAMGWIKASKKLKSASTSVNAKEDAYEEVGLNGNADEEDMGLIPPGKKLRSASTSVNAKELIILSNFRSIEEEKIFTEVFI